MTDPFRGELTVTYSVRENLEWASRERMVRKLRPSTAEEGYRRPSGELNLGSVLSRLVHSYAHA